MTNRFASRFLCVLFASLFTVALPLPGRATAASVGDSDSCKCASGNQTASSNCEGGRCYAICSQEGCEAACDYLPGSFQMRVMMNAQTVESVFEFLNHPKGDRVSIRYFKDSDRNARVTFQYKGATLLQVLEPLAQYGTISVNDVPINHLITLKQSIRNNPGIPISLSFKNQPPTVVEGFLSFLAGHQLAFTEATDTPISLEAKNLPLEKIISQLGLK